MPEPLKRQENQVGHRTKAERAARLRAEGGLTRTRVSLRAPAWLSGDARAMWDQVKRQVKAFELLDNVDAEMLAIYCDACVHYQAATRLLRVKDSEGEAVAGAETVKEAQAWARVIAQYADKLGISPTGRARLARKKAVQEQPDELESLLSEFVGAANGAR